MKYPQLVSTRAVNAISDWLVSRLEQLGVDAPHIYSRLLLSLLQSSVQINDPIEFNNLETFLANRKGSSRRYPHCDTNTLKKLNAIQCLREIVSSDQEISEIEALVDELLVKLLDIERQGNDVDENENLQVATLSITTTSLDIKLRQSNHLQSYTKHHKGVEVDAIPNIRDCAGSNRSKSGHFPSLNTKTDHSIDKSKDISDVDLDPKNRYFRAFPALTKDMEESFRILRRNAKSLTWPVDKLKISSSTTSCTNSINLQPQTHDESNISEQKSILADDINDIRSVTTNGVTRKSKRRRNQALSKGTYTNIRKNSCVTGVKGNGRYRSSSPFWDTDFEGCWEMGRDLIKEFMAKQNNRNRSTSESATYTHLSKQKILKDQNMMDENSKNTATVDDMGSLNPLNISSPPVGTENHLPTSPSNLTIGSMNSTRRLYLRDNSIENIQNNEFEYAQFEAKFDSSLEALWNQNDDIGDEIVNSGTTNYSMSSIMQLSSLSTVAPFKKNLQNFWINYYNHHFDVEKISQESHPPLLNVDDNSNSNCEEIGRNVNDSSEYCSLPTKFEKDNKKFFEYLNGISERDTPVNVFLQNTIWSDICVKDPNENLCVKDTNENFYKQIWSGNHFDLLNEKKDKSGDSTLDNSFQLHQYNKWKWSEGINVGPNANVSDQSQHLLHVKVNGGSSSSSIISSCSIEQSKSGYDTNINNNSDQGKCKHVIDCSDSSITSASTTSCSSYSHSTSYNWQTPLRGDNLEPDIQSWSSSNPISLTEMYGNDTTVKDGKRVVNQIYISPEVEDAKPFITLANHSSAASSFIEYARIKSSVKVLKHDTDKHIVFQQKQERNKEQYSDDENLLTSERTHFHPIKTYADGHSFDICSSLDVVDYERSQSGYLYLDSEKYLEYSSKDYFLNEDEPATTFGTPLYATSNCDANIFGKVNNQCDFVIKFRLRNCEVACQTDDEPIKYEPPEKIIEEHPLCLIFSSSLRGIKLQRTGLACNDAIEALNKAVEAATNIASSTRTPVDNKWLPMIAGYRSITWSMDNSKVDKSSGNGISSDVLNDENYCIYNKANNPLEQWSMREIGMKCELKGHDKNTKIHTLWGMCAACNKDLKSVPANRLLKDELQLEADEIMSDLKNMQDLYIGDYATADSDSDWEIGEAENIVDATIKDDQQDSKSNNMHNKMNNDDNEMKNSLRNICEPNLHTQDVFHKVNRLIVDLLYRENGKASVSDYVEDTDDEITHEAKSTQLNSNIWCSNIEKNIWEQPNAVLKPFDILKRINDPKNTSFSLEADKFLSHFNWEHSNLAQIWNKNTPPVTQSALYADTDHNDKHLISKAIEKKIEFDNIGKSIIVSQNLKNMNNSPTFPSKETIPSSVLSNEETKPSTINNIEQFLNSNISISNSKLKNSNRKRRHSASQNLFHTSDYGTTNNNIQINDLNKFNTKTNSRGNPIAEIESQHLDGLICESLLQNENYYKHNICANAGEDNIKQSKQTIITCKYWATINPTLSPANENLVEGTTFSCLLDKNASILKHVTMMTRPLTR